MTPVALVEMFQNASTPALTLCAAPPGALVTRRGLGGACGAEMNTLAAMDHTQVRMSRRRSSFCAFIFMPSWVFGSFTARDCKRAGWISERHQGYVNFVGTVRGIGLPISPLWR